MSPKMFSILSPLALVTTVVSAQTAAPHPRAEAIAATAAAERTNAWWKTRHAATLDRVKQGDVNLLMIGDSITHSWEKTGAAVWRKYYASRQAVNIGYSGDRTEHVLWRLRNGEIEGIAPRLAVVMIGTNNTGHRKEPVEETVAGVQAILEELRVRLPRTKVLLLAIFPRGASAQDPLRIQNENINRLLKKFADDQRVFFLNINERFVDAQGNLPSSIMPDYLHPNARGYAIWAKAMEPTVARLMGDPPAKSPAPTAIPGATR